MSAWPGSLRVSTAMASSLGLLIWALAVRLADTCLCCWPDAATYFSSDVQLLLGGSKDAGEKLEKLFMGRSGQCAIYGGRFLGTGLTEGEGLGDDSSEREDMEREAGNLFLLLQQNIQKNGKDSDQLMTEAERQKRNFSKRLEEVSNTFLAEACNVACAQSRFRPYELADCATCRLIKAPCNDPVLCAGSNVLAAVLVPITLILLGAGAGAWYYRQKKAGEGDKDTESSKSSESDESTEWSDDSDVPSHPARKTSDPIYENVPRAPAWKTSTPIYENVPRPPNFPDASYSWIPSAPIPSPPHIWSPPS